MLVSHLQTEGDTPASRAVFLGWGDYSPRQLLAKSRDIFDCHSWVGDATHLGGGRWRGIPTSHNAQDGPPQQRMMIWPEVSVVLKLKDTGIENVNEIMF